MLGLRLFCNSKFVDKPFCWFLSVVSVMSWEVCFFPQVKHIINCQFSVIILLFTHSDLQDVSSGMSPQCTLGKLEQSILFSEFWVVLGSSLQPLCKQLESFLLRERFGVCWAHWIIIRSSTFGQTYLFVSQEPKMDSFALTDNQFHALPSVLFYSPQSGNSS